jgi:hypothetical protein
MKKNKFKFEVSFNLNTFKGEQLDKHSIKEFERGLYDYVNNYAGEEGTFYTYSSDSDGEAFPTNLKVKKVAVS